MPNDQPDNKPTNEQVLQFVARNRTYKREQWLLEKFIGLKDKRREDALFYAAHGYQLREHIICIMLGAKFTIHGMKRAIDR